ncbi:hypothetical protein BGZ67_009586 [Mortierella alpina]|nr:hypothetical protein BGZ67_009586 [Mortierella alpina]
MIGSGAFGQVYQWNNRGNQMAVKRLRVTDSSALDIEKERAINSELRHKHIIQCYGVECDANYVNIITDCAEGGNLLDASPNLDWTNKKRIVVEVALGLDYLHSQDILHRDIKSANILLTKRNEAKLCDFGLAEIMISTSCISSYIQMGTRRYMAPELLTKNPVYSTKSDIFALGMVMRELVDLEDPPPLVFAKITGRCLAKDPNMRPTLEDIVNALDDEVRREPQVYFSIGGGSAVRETAGNANREYELGLRYLEGDGVDRNRAEAVERFRRAAFLGSARAQYKLGLMYKDGEGVLRDPTMGAEWLQKAAIQGHPQSQTCLGIAYRDGDEGVKQDYARALDLFRAAASQDDTSGYYNLGQMYMFGRGVVESPEEAVRWYRKAADQASAEAQTELGSLYLAGKVMEQDYSRAVEYMSKAADQGYPDAMLRLGFMYHNGQGVPQDSTKSLQLWLKAAEAGCKGAQCHVGLLFVNGDGVRKNRSVGLKWLKRAMEQGDLNAKKHYEALLADVLK